MDTLLGALAEPRRQAILHLVWTQERCAGDIAATFDVTFGAVSQHLKVLSDAGAVTVRKQGRHRFYRANQAGLGPLAKYLTTVWQSHLHELKLLAEAEERRNGE